MIERYARRMGIEQRLAKSIRSFHLDALAGPVPLNVDLDIVLSVLAGAVCASLRRRLVGYHHATPDAPATPVPLGRRPHRQRGRRRSRPVEEENLLTGPAPSRDTRGCGPLVGRTHPPLRVRLIGVEFATRKSALASVQSMLTSEPTIRSRGRVREVTLQRDLGVRRSPGRQHTLRSSMPRCSPDTEQNRHYRSS